MSEAPEMVWIVEPTKVNGTAFTYTTSVPPKRVEYIRADVSAARIADLTRQLAEAREVKPLEWRHEGRFWQATVNALGHYAVLLRDDGQYSLRMSWSLMVVDGYFDTLEAAKAAAQADYTARILSALKDPTP